MTTMIQMLLKELKNEAITTRKMLALVPDDKYDWQPHPKSMTVKQLATHIAELPGWVLITLTTDELDFASNPYNPEDINNTKDMLVYYEKNFAKAKEALLKATDEQLLPNWTLRNGNEIYSVTSKGEVIRMSYSQTVHHRAQLGVYLRLLNIPIPGSYGPSADEQHM